ncbi:MAG: DUF5060 domain-containing protein, partial [Planctomycetota bacterium]|nr:DUF5060 domain-containing protein [Planctomycetota bacterium]
MRGGFSGRISDVVLGLAGAAALSLIGAAGYREAVEAARPRQVEPPGMTAARRAMDALTPENGWFPYLADPIFGFESGLDEWRLEERGDGPREIETSDGGKEGCRPSQGKSALSVPVAFPDPTTVFRSPPGVAGVRAFVYDVYVPEGAPGFIGCLMFLKDKDGRWFQARNPHRLIPGRWNTVVAEISGGSPDVAPLGHMGSWDASQATQIRTIGFTFYGSEPWKGRLLLDNIRGCMLPDRFISMLDRVAARGIPDAEKLSPAELEDRKKRVEALRSLVPAARAAASAASSKLELLNWTAGPDTVPRFGTFEIRFELPGQIDNPFDPNIADVSAAFIAPSGKQIGVFGYYDQDYERRRADLKDDLIPVGRPFWRIRFTPREVGEYSYSVRVRALGGEIVTSKRTFRTVQS